MNRICLVGRITRDLELKKTPQGLSVVNFSIAVNKYSKDPNNTADFFDCVVFGQRAENLCKYQKKGSLISVEGRLDTRTYQAKDGTNRKVYEVICDQINYLGSKSNNEENNNSEDNTDEEVISDDLSTANVLPF